MTISPWLLAFRPKTLTAALIPILVGTALVPIYEYGINWKMSFYALASALWIQIGTNLINDSLDFKKGADTEERIGPTRATQSGLLSSRQVFWGGILSFLFALIFGIPLVIQGGWVIVAIGVISLLLGYAYTGGPCPLAYVGLGDLFVILFFGLVAVGGVFYLHTGTYNIGAFIAGLQVGMLCTVLIAINNLRDVNQDKGANKKTLAVRFGERFAKTEILVLYAVSFLLLNYWALQGYPLAALLPLLSFPLVYKLSKGLLNHKPGMIYNKYLTKASLIYLIFGFQLSLGFFLS